MMAENRFSTPATCHKDYGKETVCIETNRILDSCRDRDCFENVKVFLTELGEDIIEHTTQVRVKESSVAWTYIGIDPVQFNGGFYTVSIRFYIKLVFEGCVCGHTREFDGMAVLEKKVVLFGGESNVSIFKSCVENGGFCSEPEPCYKERTVPCAVVEVVDPIVLDVRVLEKHPHLPVCCCCCATEVPESVQGCLSAPLYVDATDRDDRDCDRRILVVSIGLFSLVRLVRPAQYIINAAEFVIPDKECVAAEHNDPCAIFNSIPFPVTEFAPPSPVSPCVQHPTSDRNRCGC